MTRAPSARRPTRSPADSRTRSGVCGSASCLGDPPGVTGRRFPAAGTSSRCPVTRCGTSRRQMRSVVSGLAAVKAVEREKKGLVLANLAHHLSSSCDDFQGEERVQSRITFFTFLHRRCNAAFLSGGGWEPSGAIATHSRFAKVKDN